MVDHLLAKNLARTAEVINTINGGMVQPQLNILKLKDEWQLTAIVPGVSPDNLKVELKEDYLFIFHIIKESTDSIELPVMVGLLPVNAKFDLDGIVAQYLHDRLIIHLPLNKNSRGYEREIKIVRK